MLVRESIQRDAKGTTSRVTPKRYTEIYAYKYLQNDIMEIFERETDKVT